VLDAASASLMATISVSPFRRQYDKKCPICI
jgi:hypothetical protein